MSSAKPETTHAGRAGMHQSNTVDLMVIISGELWGYQSDADEGVLLKQGDTFIQRGTESRLGEPERSTVPIRGRAGRRPTSAVSAGG